MAYRSEIKLQIGEVPKTKDTNTLPDFIDIYNSIHILNQYMDRVVKELNPEIDPSKPIYEIHPFKIFFYGVVRQAVIPGDIVSCYRDQGDWPAGWYLGAPSWPINASSFSVGSVNNGFVGVVLEEGEADSEVKIGIGPAVLRTEGVLLGQTIFARRAFSPSGAGTGPLEPNGIGSLYIANLNTTPEAYGPDLEYLAIGAVIGDQSVYVYDHVDYWATQAANNPLVITPPDGGGGE